MGHALKLHPGVVLVTVTAGTLLGGIAGAVVAVPITAVAFRVTACFHETRPEDDEPPPGESSPGESSPGESSPGESIAGKPVTEKCVTGKTLAGKSSETGEVR